MLKYLFTLSKKRVLFVFEIKVFARSYRFSLKLELIVYFNGGGEM